MDSETRRAIEGFRQEIVRLNREVDTLRRGQRTPQLSHSSIESGSLDVIDPDTGETRQRIGYQPDGTVGIVTEGGDPPPAPSAPIVAAAPVGLMVQWDGTLSDPEGVLPSDFDHVSVHVSQTSGFAPTAATFVGTIPRAGGLYPVVPLEVGQTYYVLLVPVGTGGVEGAPSAESSGVPEGVGGVPEPGSITETEIADDAVTSPKIRALAVQAHHIVASAIEAGHITAGAVEASKLAATIVLSTRIVAGDPMAARVELDSAGLRGYNELSEVIFAIDSAGNAVFSGNITGSEITGSRMTIGTSGNTGVIEDVSGAVRLRVDSSDGPRGEMRASATQSLFAVWADPDASGTPTGGVFAQDDRVVFYAHSVAGDSTSPWAEQTAFPGEARTRWSSGDGSEVQVRALPDYAAILLSAPPATDPTDAQSAGFVYAQRYSSNDIAAVSMQGPEWMDNTGPEHQRRASIFVEGARPERAYTRIVHAAKRHRIQGEAISDVYDTTSDGVLELANTHSILAPRHAPLSTVLTTNPTFSTSGSYVDFTSGQMPTIEFRTGWSGRVKISLMSAGYNNTGNDTNLRLAFRLSGAQTISADPARGTWMTNAGTGSTTRQMSTRITVMNLHGNADYVLHPQWYSSTNTGTAFFSIALGNTIIVEPLM